MNKSVLTHPFKLYVYKALYLEMGGVISLYKVGVNSLLINNSFCFIFYHKLFYGSAVEEILALHAKYIQR